MHRTVESLAPGFQWRLILLLLLLATVARAQSGASSVLTGNVVDAATHAPVADVVVTATSPSLQGEQMVVTDATGLYRIPQLPPGTYTLRFEKETYRPFTRAGIDARALDRTLRLNVELLPETAGEARSPWSAPRRRSTSARAPPAARSTRTSSGTSPSPGPAARAARTRSFDSLAASRAPGAQPTPTA